MRFLKGLLEKNPEKRFSAAEALKHEFISGMKVPKGQEDIDIEEGNKSLEENVNKFNE